MWTTEQLGMSLQADGHSRKPPRSLACRVLEMLERKMWQGKKRTSSLLKETYFITDDQSTRHFVETFTADNNICS